MSTILDNNRKALGVYLISCKGNYYINLEIIDGPQSCAYLVDKEQLKCFTETLQSLQRQLTDLEDKDKTNANVLIA